MVLDPIMELKIHVQLMEDAEEKVTEFNKHNLKLKEVQFWRHSDIFLQVEMISKIDNFRIA